MLGKNFKVLLTLFSPFLRVFTATLTAEAAAALAADVSESDPGGGGTIMHLAS